MFERRHLASSVFVLVLVLAPGLSLAAGQHPRTPAAEESLLDRLFTWMERAWDAVTGDAPRDPVLQKAGCGIDPNGTCVPGGGVITNSTGGH